MDFFPIRVFLREERPYPSYFALLPGGNQPPWGIGIAARPPSFFIKSIRISNKSWPDTPVSDMMGWIVNPWPGGVFPLISRRGPPLVAVSNLQGHFFTPRIQAVEAFFHSTTPLLFPQKSSPATLLIEVPSMFRAAQTIMLLLLSTPFKPDEIVWSTSRTGYTTLPVCFPGLKHLENRRHFALVVRKLI